MRNFIISLALILIVCFSMLGISLLLLTDPDKDNVSQDFVEEGTEYEDEEDDVTIALDSIEFTKLKKCTVETADDYVEGNALITIFDVSFKFKKISMIVQIGDLDRSFSNLKLTFKLNGKEEYYTIKSVFPGSQYEIIIPKHDATSFQLIEAVWDDIPKEMARHKEFGFPIILKGTTTLKTYIGKSILIMDDFGTIINEIDTKFGGTFVLNQCASYYVEVR